MKREYYYDGDILYLKCYMCGEFLPIDEFYKDRSKRFGVGSKCKKCHNKYNKEHPEQYRKYRHSHPEAHKRTKKNWLSKKRQTYGHNIKTFHKKTREYIKKYNLRPEVCSICGQGGDIDAHHPSYESRDSRKYIIFVCRQCHKKIHTGNIECPKPINLLDLIPN